MRRAAPLLSLAALATGILVSGAHAAPPIPVPPPGAFDLLETSQVAGIAVVEAVKHPSDRVERATVRIDAPAVGSVTNGRIDVLHRRRFSSDDPVRFRTGSTIVLLATPLPAASEWNAMRARDGDAPLYVQDGARAFEIAPEEAATWSDALGAWHRVHGGRAESYAARSFLVDQLSLGVPALGREAALTLARSFSRGSPPELHQLEDSIRWLARADDPALHGRALARAVASRMPSDELERLAPLFEHRALRATAISALARRAEDDPALRMTVATAALDWAMDPDPHVRRSAVEVLALDGTPEAIDLIGSFALNETEHDVAAAAVHALDELRSTEPGAAYDGLGRVARDAPASTAALAMERLAVADDPSALDALLGVFETPRADLHAAAVIALMNMNQPRARETVLRLRDEHPDPRVRRAVAAMVDGTH